MTRRSLLGLTASALALRFGYARSTENAPKQSATRFTDDGSRNTPFAEVTPGYRMRFPHDEGSHPAFRTEWWYITGWLELARGAPAGFQITFFRTRPQIDEMNPSAFTPRQIVIAHAAISDAARGRLLHDQHVARAVFGLAGADEGRTRVWIDDWSLVQSERAYRARIPARDFAMNLTLEPTQPPLLQGDEGVSRKGPRPASASYYYSLAHLKVTGTVFETGKESRVSGRAWLDHEWSSSYMDERAVGWDWIGINMDDGGALMAFRMRDRAGKKFWAGATYRDAHGFRRTLAADDVEFTPLRFWRSPRTGATYPVAWHVKAGGVEITIEPTMDDQEIDTRLSVGTVYWEGAARATREKKPVGRGYLELTGYWQAMKV